MSSSWLPNDATVARDARRRQALLVETFWTIMVYAFVFGMAALGGFVSFYWFVVVGEREASARRAPIGRG